MADPNDCPPGPWGLARLCEFRKRYARAREAQADASIYRWELDHDEFCQALKGGKEVADERVERSV